ncbi:SDR family oxidoreductase [Halomonas sp. McH1-25]|uniref:SDR family oxidoreductase n=2 Tax=Halomonas TaxID=2745 RepID=UPI001EF734EE|nr:MULTISPECIES: SDR family oxidoreductase [unclassified Halomonas]MCG7601252.1 SDR family oxidoreductase [Halomonas sp. McH1-25]MCP1343710.1 SDR family oxidoreductase [Halomonas sp. FL8]
MNVMSQFDLSGKVAVVTGGNGGLGEAFAHALAEAGAAVAIAARGHERSLAVVKALQDAGHRAMAVEIDITQPEAADVLLDEVEATLGPVDIFLNNAGACQHAPALEVTPERWRDIFDINVHGLWYCAQAAGRRMQSRGGVIINIGSISAMIVNRPQMQPAYNASKAAVHQLTKSLAAEWAPYGIRVNALAPGYVKTSMAPVDDPRFKPRWIDDAPMQRAATPEELGPTIVYMASNASSFMTGSIVVVDGGYTLW